MTETQVSNGGDLVNAEMQVFRTEEFELEMTPVGDTFTVQAPGLARALGIRDAFRLVESIPDEEKGYTTTCTRSENGVEQRREVYHVTEPGFYRAIGQRQAARIKDPSIRGQVVRFQNWVYREVLPAIRKTGRYETTPSVPQSFAAALELAAAQQREIEVAKAKVAELEPLAAKYTAVLDAEGLIGMTAIGDMLDVDVRTLTDWLVEQGVFRKQVSQGQRGPRTRNMPRRSWQTSGHFEVHPEHRGREKFPVAYATSAGLDHILTLWSTR